MWIGGDRIQNVLWRSNNFAWFPYFQSVVVLCGTNNIQQESLEDIVDEILEIALTLRRKCNHLNIVVCDLLPRDENWIYIKEMNDYLSDKCDLNGVNFIKPNDWTLRNGFLKANLVYVHNLCFTRRKQTIWVIVNVIELNSKTNESVLMLSKLFKHTADFNFNY